MTEIDCLLSTSTNDNVVSQSNTADLEHEGGGQVDDVVQIIISDSVQVTNTQVLL